MFESIGVVQGQQQSINDGAVNGNVVSLGFCLKPDPGLTSITAFKQVAIKFSMVYTLVEFQFCADRLDAGYLDAQLMISKTIAFLEVPEMIAHVQRGETSEVKVHADTAL